ncbi:MAG: glycerophosphodiester phosphodiesterase [Geminicoccaceae bacterium]
MDSVATENLDDQRFYLRQNVPAVIGHRGAARYAPENTLASVRKAHELGVQWVEVDVKLSADRIPFLLHDTKLDRTTDGRGRASRRTMEELSVMDAGSWFAAASRGERLPTLVALIALLDRLDMGLNLEIKPTPGSDRETTDAIVDVLRRHWPEHRPWPLLSSFSLAALARARDIAIDMPRGLLIDEFMRDWPGALDELQCASLHINHKVVTPDLLSTATEEGIPVLLYTVNDGSRAVELLQAGASSIITDAPDVIFDAIGGTAPLR